MQDTTIPTNKLSYLPLTQENLDLLLSTYESKIDQLDRLEPIFIDPNEDKLNFSWNGPRNRFFDVRWDNHYYNLNINNNCKCKNKYIEGPDGVGPISFCDCELERCSEYTDDVIDFVRKACPQSLTFDVIDSPDKSPYFGKPDKYSLRTKIPSWNHAIMTVNLASIPILQRNIGRCSKEILRQESFKWTMAMIRTLFLVGSGLSVWHVLNKDGKRVQIGVPHEMVISIMYWTKI